MSQSTRTTIVPKRGCLAILFLLLALAGGVILLDLSGKTDDDMDVLSADSEAAPKRFGSRTGGSLANNSPRKFEIQNVTLWWEEIPSSLRSVASSNPTPPRRETGATQNNSAAFHNIHPPDYAGPQSCAKCHPANYQHWSQHPHRRMNALADENTVVGDFSGKVGIVYLGGKATFTSENGRHRMNLERDGLRIVYQVRQTIGSRFFQYYVGRMIEGADALGTLYAEVDHVLPFGYWIDRRQWVPVVHVHGEKPDRERYDPFAPPMNPQTERDLFVYAKSCNHCHTTFPLADILIKYPWSMARFPEERIHWSMAPYLQDSRPQLLSGLDAPREASEAQIWQVINTMASLDAPTHAVTLGVSCEACHLGAKEHAEGKRERPSFLPASPHLLVEKNGAAADWSRTKAINYACGRCHAGDRPQFANGSSTWNSTEFSDAWRGGCYSQLTCIHCHNPHQGIGPKWSRTADQDDASCLDCHQKYEPAAARVAHTHHPMGSAGSRCMNCHMPRINEGLQDVVRTHTIFSPTHSRMVEENHPNACNLCHVEMTIDWTIDHLAKWYNADFSKRSIDRNYPHRKRPATVGWLKHEFEPVRMVAADALTRAGATWALPELIQALDDEFLLNRQFTQIGMEKMLQRDLQEFGYRFYQNAQERQEPLARMRKKLLKTH